MYFRIPLKGYRDINPRAFLLGTDVFEPCNSYRRKKESHFNERVVESLLDGSFCALITDAQRGKLKTRTSKSLVDRVLDSEIMGSPHARCIELGVAKYVDEYKGMPAYDKLFRLLSDGNMHFADLTAVIGAVELEKPIVSNDDHFYLQQTNIQRAYRERHNDVRKVLPIFTAQSFCKDVLQL